MKIENRGVSLRRTKLTVEQLEERSLLACILGTEGPDTLNGTTGDDCVDGLGGNDIVNGSFGNDTVYGGSGRDTINGNQGMDFVYGGNDDDPSVGGGADDDWIVNGEDGNDSVFGGLGNDGRIDQPDLYYVQGGPGDDFVYGGGGNDVVRGGQGNDFVFGDDSPDLQTTNTGNDLVFGGFGNDHVYGGRGSDTVYAGEDDDYIYDDELAMNSTVVGNDTLYGEAGNDHFVIRGGIDTATGGPGADIYEYEVSNDILSWNPLPQNWELTIMDFKIGEDQLNLHTWAMRGFGLTRLYQNFSDLLYRTTEFGGDTKIQLWIATSVGSGRSEIVTYYAIATIVLKGILKNDLTLETFVDVTGNDPNNPNHFGPQVDRSGNDTIGDPPNADTGLPQTIYGADGDDTIHGWNGDDFVQGNLGADTVYGDAGNDTVRGGKDSDNVYGGQGNDIVVGGNDQDELWGGPGDDELFGDRLGLDDPLDPREDGADTIHGEGGSNQLEGGGGKDYFIIQPDPGTTDTIWDFRETVLIPSSREDRIDLSVFSTIRTFEQLFAVAVQVGPDVRLDLPNKTVVIKNLNRAGLVPDMFFGGAGSNASPPNDIVLSSNSVAENLPSGFEFATLSAVDPNNDGPFVFQFATGAGDADNQAFAINVDKLSTAATFDFETKPSYSVRIRVTDAAGMTFEKAIVISIQDVNESPSLTVATASVNGNVLSQLTNSGTWRDPEGNNVTLTALPGTVIKNANGTWDWSYIPTEKLVNQVVTVSANDGANTTSVSFTINANIAISLRGLFYAGATGDEASTSLAADKAPLLPGETSSFANYSNFSSGLNGLVVDVAGLPASTTDVEMLASLQFAEWNGIAAEGFTSLPLSAVPTITILNGSGTGGSTRVRITFPDNTVQNTWLRVTVLANAQTGLAANDVFYFGNVMVMVTLAIRRRD